MDDQQKVQEEVSEAMGDQRMRDEVSRVREAAEATFRSGEPYHPKLAIYAEDALKVAVGIREPSSEDDARAAFAEACLLIPLVHGNRAVYSYDSYVAGEDASEQIEAITVIYGGRKNAMAVICPYLRTPDGQFANWGDDQHHTMNSGVLDLKVVSTLAHFMRYHAHFPAYSAEAMMRALERRGHSVVVPEPQPDEPEASDQPTPAPATAEVRI